MGTDKTTADWLFEQLEKAQDELSRSAYRDPDRSECRSDEDYAKRMKDAAHKRKPIEKRIKEIGDKLTKLERWNGEKPTRSSRS